MNFLATPGPVGAVRPVLSFICLRQAFRTTEEAKGALTHNPQLSDIIVAMVGRQR